VASTQATCASLTSELDRLRSENYDFEEHNAERLSELETLSTRKQAVSWQRSEVHSAQTVTTGSTVPVIWPCTGELTQARNRMNVVFAVKALERPVKLSVTAEFTVDRNRTNVTCVTRRLVSLDIKTDTLHEFTRSHTVIKVLGSMCAVNVKSIYIQQKKIYCILHCI